jgi:hypothetical protein
METEECSSDEPAKYIYQQHYLLETISLDPALTYCGLAPFETLKIYHNGTAWVADAEAIVTKGFLDAI